MKRWAITGGIAATTICGIGALGWLAIEVARADDASTRVQSAAFFMQIAPVLESPRCMNCHPADAHPTQGDDRHRHQMNVTRGPDDHGAPGLHCSTCHQASNQTASGAPGAPDWHLAPLRMAWQGKTAGEICRTILDPARGGFKASQLTDHFGKDDFVLWAFAPGTDSDGKPRTLPPMTHEQFTAIAGQWIATGAACPK